MFATAGGHMDEALVDASAVMFLLELLLGGLIVSNAKRGGCGAAWISAGSLFALIGAHLQVQKLVTTEWTKMASISLWFYAFGGLLVVIGMAVGIVRIRREDREHEHSRAGVASYR